MAAPALERLVFQAFAGLGDIDGLEDNALDLSIAVAASGNHIHKRPVELAASASTSVDLSAIFEAVTIVGVIDVTSASAGGMLVGGNTDKQTLAANGFIIWYNHTGTPPTVYFTAPAGESKYLELVAIGKRT